MVLRHAPTRNRTENLLIKSQLLCQLSYRRGAETSSETTGCAIRQFLAWRAP